MRRNESQKKMQRSVARNNTNPQAFKVGIATKVCLTVEPIKLRILEPVAATRNPSVQQTRRPPTKDSQVLSKIWKESKSQTSFQPPTTSTKKKHSDFVIRSSTILSTAMLSKPTTSAVYFVRLSNTSTTSAMEIIINSSKKCSAADRGGLTIKKATKLRTSTGGQRSTSNFLCSPKVARRRYSIG